MWSPKSTALKRGPWMRMRRVCFAMQHWGEITISVLQSIVDTNVSLQLWKTGDQVECAEVTSSVGCFRLLKKMREGISLVGFHSLIDQKQKNCHQDKQQHFYPHGNGASLLRLFRLDVCQGNILGDIFGCEWFFHPEVTELQRPACSPFDWSAAASTVQREREFQIILRPTTNVSTTR